MICLCEIVWFTFLDLPGALPSPFSFPRPRLDCFRECSLKLLKLITHYPPGYSVSLYRGSRHWLTTVLEKGAPNGCHSGHG